MRTVRRRSQRPPRQPTAAEARCHSRLQKRHEQWAKEQTSLKRWISKLKRALHVVEKQQQRIARLERKLAELEKERQSDGSNRSHGSDLPPGSTRTS